MITCDMETLRAIRAELLSIGAPGPLRIELCFTGCCDPSLGLRIDEVRENDLVHEAGGVRFVLDRDAYDLVGDVTISYTSEGPKEGFVLTSERPVSEWAGFSPCRIRPAGTRGTE